MTQEKIDQLKEELHTAMIETNATWLVAQTHKHEIEFAQSETDRATKQAEYQRMAEVYKKAKATEDQAWERLEAAKIEAGK